MSLKGANHLRKKFFTLSWNLHRFKKLKELFCDIVSAIRSAMITTMIATIIEQQLRHTKIAAFQKCITNKIPCTLKKNNHQRPKLG
jgi:hypothetical protein